MRKSMSTSRSRFIRGGLAAAAVTATVLAATATPALATATITVLPTTGVAGQTGTVTVTGTGLFTASVTAVPGALFTTATTCPATFSVTAVAPAINAVASKVLAATDTAVITLPATLVPNVYSVCVYATATASAALASTAPVATYTVTPEAPVLSVTSSVTGVAATTVASSSIAAYLTTAVTPGINFSVATCASTYTTPSAVGIFTATATRTASSATITVPLGLVAGTTYNVCIYSTNVTGTSKLLGTASFDSTAPPITANVSSGPSGGGNSVTVASTTAIFTGISTVGVTFATACVPLYSDVAVPTKAAVATPSSNNLATFTVPAGVVVADNPYMICLYNGIIGGTSSLIGATTALTAYSAALPIITLSATTGQTTGGNTITGQAPTNFLASIPAPGVAFVAATGACPTTFTSVLNLTTTGQRIAPDRFAVTVPSLVVSPTEYKVCVYDGTTVSSPLLAAAPSYTAAAATVITSISPTAGAAQGNSLVTVTGSGLPAVIVSAAIGGVPLTAIVKTSSTTFTALTPAHPAAANLALTVVTSGGSYILRNAYTYTNGIAVSPNTAPHSASSVSVYVVGAGFTTPNFSTTSTDAHIYLVDGVYDPALSGGNKTLGPVAECTNVLVIGDTELICKMALDHRLAADGTLDVVGTRGVTDGVTTTGTTFTSATADFTSADVGLTLSVAGDTEVPIGTYIVSVTNPTTVVLSATVLAPGNPIVATIGASRSVAAITTVLGSTTATGIAGKFLAADVGRPITGAGIAAGTTIASVAVGGATATLSIAAGAGAGAGAVVISAAAPVLDGAYTMTFVTNGAIDAATTDTGYSQSIITSGSTFTVSDY